MPLVPYRGVMPKIAPTAFVAPNATIIGDVEVGADSSIWFGAVLRGDVMPIRVGARTSIQDNSVVHATGGWAPAIIGDDCTVGHAVVLHGCTVGNRVLVGMGSVVLDAVRVGDDVIIGAGSVVTARTSLESGHLVLGRPARPARPLKDADLHSIREAAHLYVGYARDYRTGP